MDSLLSSIVNALGCPSVISDAALAVESLGRYAVEQYEGLKVNSATTELLGLCGSDSAEILASDCEIRVRTYLEKQLNSNKCFMGLPSQILAIRKCYECPEGEQYPWAAPIRVVGTYFLLLSKGKYQPTSDKANNKACVPLPT